MYKKCLETENMKAEAYNGLACCAAAQGDYTKALSYIEKGLKTKDLEMKQVLLFNQIVFFENIWILFLQRRKSANIWSDIHKIKMHCGNIIFYRRDKKPGTVDGEKQFPGFIVLKF